MSDFYLVMFVNVSIIIIKFKYDICCFAPHGLGCMREEVRGP